ncbi:putative ccaat-binding transcription factor subunit A [Hibiscus syriacus]|uniref:Ccaat-binding transcription factor subunit A n=1 Tax=Hibiscus syriacus TaxID=106335 RepID=A0A6A2Y844_HIBSY|nr:cleavage and polyadenylation specificity factor subunit 6-like [Hibiscus syriacus]XP_039042343.1 cleavage and polyadenylation specificity factor subunit 6-like [Hibiscus syriacus]KAE8665864.1 putative ccaat-binding transcription factor subunit A [Hibiscus syriacus]
MDEGEGGDQMELMHRNEAISAVADDGFLGEEDDDYEDLYNDVNVGEGFLHSLRKNEDLVFRKEETKDDANQNDNFVNNNNVCRKVGGSPMGALESGVLNPRVADGVERGDFMISHESQGFRGGAYNDVKGPNVGVGGGGSGLRVELAQASIKLNDMAVDQSSNNNYNGLAGVSGMGQQGRSLGNVGGVENEGLMRQGVVGAGNVKANGGGCGGSGPMIGNGVGNVGVASAVRGSAPGVCASGGGSGGGTILFVGDLHWWTTDAELESELCKYGPVKEVKFFDEKASGKSKGYCQVEFYDPAAATACKEGMNGHVFNGRPCVVAFASPFTVKKMGEAQLNRNQQMAQSALSQAGRGRNDAGGKPVGINIQTGGNYQGGDNNNRGYGRGNMGRGNAQGMGNRGPVGPMRNRAGGMGGRGIMGNGFGQGIGVAPHLMRPQSMTGQGFGPSFGGAMGRMGGYGGFPGALMSPFSGMLNSFPPVGGVGLPGVAPHVNPAFFGRGMPMNGMGMMPSSGVDRPNMGWSDPGMGGWGGDEHGVGRAGESSYGEEAAFDHQHGVASHDRGSWQNPVKEKDRASEKEWSGSSERRYRDDREPGYDRDMTGETNVGHGYDWPERRHQDDRDIGRERDRERDWDQDHSRDRDRNNDRERDRERDQDRYREDKDRYEDHHKYRNRESEHSNDWDRGQSSRTHSKSRLYQEEEHRSRSRDADYGKRRRLTSD